MEYLKNKFLLILGIIIFSLLILFGLFYLWKNSQISKQTLTYQNLSNTKVTFDVNKVPDQFYQNDIRNTKNITIELVPYTVDPSHFSLQFTADQGKYEYNVIFNNNGLDIIIGVDSQLASNPDSLKKVITRIILASAAQKTEKQLISGSLQLDKNIMDDHLSYLNKVTSDKNINQLSIVNFQ